MRTLLMNNSTGLYFQGPDKWTPDPALAHNFKLIDRALEFITKWKLKNVELVFAFRGKGTVKRVSPEKFDLHYSQTH